MRLRPVPSGRPAEQTSAEQLDVQAEDEIGRCTRILDKSQVGKVAGIVKLKNTAQSRSIAKPGEDKN